MDLTHHQHMELNGGADLQGFRQALRTLLMSHIPAEQVSWSVNDAPDLFGGQAPAAYGVAGKPVTLPRCVGEMIELVVCHRDPQKYALLYELVWRMKTPKGPEPKLPANAADPLVSKLIGMEKSVRRDLHKMHAFLRFRQVNDQKLGDRMIAWFEPEHFIVEKTAQFFVDRFGSFDWTIMTPKGSIWWDRRELAIGPPARRPNTLESDAFDMAWRTYYESTFNPARANLSLMRGHMPKKYWRNLPETQAIPAMVRNASSRVVEMIEQEPAMPVKRNPDKAVAAMSEPAVGSLAELNRIIAASEPFVEGSDKAVLGEGPMHPDIAFVGEQPGDQEDQQGRPFVGPAGQLFDKALDEAGIERRKAYITNAVKHFKFVQRGKRRLHQSPTAGEIKRYRWWLEKELGFVRPKLVVALGASAAHALEGKAVPVGRNRGPHEFPDRPGYITVHPSYLLRLRTEEERKEGYKAFVADLKKIRSLAD